MVKEQYNPYILAFGYETDPDWDVPYLEKLNEQNNMNDELNKLSINKKGEKSDSKHF